jgi:hypothetical protein
MVAAEDTSELLLLILSLSIPFKETRRRANAKITDCPQVFALTEPFQY